MNHSKGWFTHASMVYSLISHFDYGCLAVECDYYVIQ